MDNEKTDDQLERNRHNHPVLDDDERNFDDFNEETATEIIDDDMQSEAREDPNVKGMYGWIALALSVISLFFIPLIFAGAAIIVGFIARNRDAQVLGNTAIIIGALSIVFRLFILPLT